MSVTSPSYLVTLIISREDYKLYNSSAYFVTLTVLKVVIIIIIIIIIISDL
jgi:hypothetical protein